jgi:carbon-monoxide dehydrogenase small subunit
MELTLRVNGGECAVDVPAGKILADVLREDCGLTGTHLGCEQGVCGSCTVLYNGWPVRSCLLFAVQCTDAEITTATRPPTSPSVPRRAATVISSLSGPPQLTRRSPCLIEYMSP